MPNGHYGNFVSRRYSPSMDELVIVALLVTTAGLAVAAARGILMFIFRVMTHPPSISIQWRLVTFVVALFWFWYLAPTVTAHLR